ncbi:ZIP family metal transporter [Candidatus Pacearchaeota archaeon]|nr:ZIP family metal transporter [Candidatus Pacearchaeota archaeon]
MNEIIVYSLVSVIIVSLVSLVGLFTLGIQIAKLRKALIYLISFSAGALFGDAFIHLLPEAVAENGFGINISLYFLLGIVIFFVLEKVIHWHHCHGDVLDEKHAEVHPFAYMNLIGDGLHNFLDGVIIAASYLVSIPAGIATTIAVALHEIPQEIGDFGVLIHGGFSKAKALLMNFGSALLAVLGAVVVFLVGSVVFDIEMILVPIAAGGFIYIAGSDLIPELHKHSTKLSHGLGQLIAFLLGIGVMWALTLLE